jgi:hypothetical protein
MYLAAGRCRQAADAALSRCSDGAAQILAALQDPACEADATELLAMFAVRWDQGEGVPVVGVPVRASGAPPAGDGRWADDLPAFLADPGSGMAPLSAFVKVFHHAEIEVKRAVSFSYPEAALDMHLGRQRCDARVSIDEGGVPYDVTVDGCLEVFHGPVRGTLMRWRWYPPKDGRERIQGRTTVKVTFDP